MLLNVVYVMKQKNFSRLQTGPFLALEYEVWIRSKCYFPSALQECVKNFLLNLTVSLIEYKN